MHRATTARRRRCICYPPATVRPKDRAWLRIGQEMPADPLDYAAVLYETLHRLDAQGLDWIAVERPPETPEWAGVLDRLRRASE